MQLVGSLRFNKQFLRWLLHGLCWAFIILPGFFISTGKYDSPYGWYAIAGYFFILMVAIYFNLYWLLPRFLALDRYFIYIIAAISLVVAVGFLQTFWKVIASKYFLNSHEDVAFIAVLFKEMAVFAMYFIMFTGFKLGRDWFKQRADYKRLQLEKLKAEVNYLKAQIHPHFLFNTLNNIYALTLNQSPKAPEVVLRLSEVMSYMVYDGESAEVGIEKELKYIRNYIELERLRCSAKVRIDYIEEWDHTPCNIAPLILLPYIENGFKHGIYNNAASPYLKIRISIIKGRLILRVENEIRKSNAEEGAGFGLDNSQKRLELLYKGRYKLDAVQGNGVYTVELILEL